MDIRHIAQYQIKEVLEQNKVKGEFNSHMICAPIEIRTYFSLIVEKVELEDMPRLFLKIKLDKQTHIEVQYYLIG